MLENKNIFFKKPLRPVSMHEVVKMSFHYNLELADVLHWNMNLLFVQDFWVMLVLSVGIFLTYFSSPLISEVSR